MAATSDAAALARTAAAGSIGGALCGLGAGLLGRLAMRLLAITSPAQAQGLVTDDDAIVGEISVGGTLNLLAFTVPLGAAGGLAFLLARRVLPASLHGRSAGFALFMTAVGGALFVHGHGSFDFTVLAPVWLAVAVFVALPLLYGLAVPLVVAAVDGPVRRGSWWLVGPLAVAALAPPVLLLPALLGLATAVAVGRVALLGRLWDSRATTVAATLLYAGLVAAGVLDLAVDVESLVAQRPPLIEGLP